MDMKSSSHLQKNGKNIRPTQKYHIPYDKNLAICRNDPSELDAADK